MKKSSWNFDMTHYYTDTLYIYNIITFQSSNIYMQLIILNINIDIHTFIFHNWGS